MRRGFTLIELLVVIAIIAVRSELLATSGCGTGSCQCVRF
jgi:prepilin-type N-terminal cleavage/methylation domain-containing protein